MLSLVRYLEVQKMEGKRSSFNLVSDEDLGLRSSTTGMPKDGAVPGETAYFTDVVNPGEHGAHEQSGKSYKEFEDGEHESVGAVGHGSYGNLLGPGDYRRFSQWNSHSESLSEHSERYKRGIGSVTDVGLEDRRVRSRPEASAVLTNLLGRREETDLHMSISARTLKPSGGKDRHSKVFTAKGPRDRRVRLSVSTAIQFYDVQDRLGYDQPSKAVEWLMKKAKNAIDELSQIPLPGIDRLVPSSSSNSVYHPYGYESSEFLTQSSSSDVQLKGLGGGGGHGQASLGSSELASSEVKASREQAVDESDTFLSTRQSGGSSSRRGELATDITMSVGEVQRKNNSQVHHTHHLHAGLSSFSTSPMSNTSNFLLPSSASSSGGRQAWKCMPSQQHPPGGGGYLYDDPCSPLPPTSHEQQQQQQQRLQGLFHASPLQYHNHLLTVQQSYLQQDFQTGGALQHQQQGHGLLHSSQSATVPVLPFGMMPSGTSQHVAAGAKPPYLDHFHTLKIAPGAEKNVIATDSPSVASSSTPAGRGATGFTVGSGLLRVPTGEVFQKPQLVGGFSVDGLEEQLSGGMNGKKT